MSTGELVPDAVILRLIANELTTRGWIKARLVTLLSLNTYSSAKLTYQQQ